MYSYFSNGSHYFPGNPAKKIVSVPISTDLRKEVEISLRGIGILDEMKALGENSDYSCTDCGGVLFEMQGESNTRYKCHTGHSYLVNDLFKK